MSERLVPAYADTRKVFEQQAEISGAVSLDRLPRFRQILTSDEASISVNLRFTKSKSGQKLISGDLSASVEVQCQRCLEPLRIDLQDEFRLILVREEAEAERLPPDLDPWINADYRLPLGPLVEEQLLLCMPIVSYHAAGNCTSASHADPDEPDNGAEESEDHPFAILKSLKKSD